MSRGARHKQDGSHFLQLGALVGKKEAAAVTSVLPAKAREVESSWSELPWEGRCFGNCISKAYSSFGPGVMPGWLLYQVSEA